MKIYVLSNHGNGDTQRKNCFYELKRYNLQ